MPKNISIILVTILFASLLIFANTKGYLDGARDTATILATPITRLFTGTGQGFTTFFGSLLNLGKLQRENAALKDESAKLKSDLARLTETEEENKSLRKELGFVAKSKMAYEAADVTGYDPSNLRGMISINKGSASGVSTGMAVTSEGYLVGRVSEVTEHTAKVQLITDPTSAIPVAVQNTKTNGIAKGELGSGLTMEKIPQGEKVSVGNTVITSGLGGEVPRGIIIGEVESLESQENSLFVSAKIKLRSNLNNILRVMIIKSQ